MRSLLVFAAALLMLAPAVAADDLPVPVRAEATTPSDDCPDCVGVLVGAGAALPGCFDCPAFGAGVWVQHENGTTTAGARACYSSFFVICFVDEQVTVPA